MKILIVSDAWLPQVNGVVRTLENLAGELCGMGHEVHFATPEGHWTVPLPTYPEIRLAAFPRRRLQNVIEQFTPDAVHIVTEGSLGIAARAICLARGLRFTTSFHTRFPEYMHLRFPLLPKAPVYAALRLFHRKSSATMVATASLKQELEREGFSNLVLWSRGVDANRFSPIHRQGIEGFLPQAPRPIFLYVGRIAVEKNLEAFLRLDIAGTKVVVGHGPQRAELQARFPAAIFVGQKTGDELAQIYASSDAFVFPSRTDTFGLVLLEALACGTPVAAYPVGGPADVLAGASAAVLGDDLHAAATSALRIARDSCRRFALKYSWRASAEQFIANLAVSG